MHTFCITMYIKQKSIIHHPIHAYIYKCTHGQISELEDLVGAAKAREEKQSKHALKHQREIKVKDIKEKLEPEQELLKPEQEMLGQKLLS